MGAELSKWPKFPVETLDNVRRKVLIRTSSPGLIPMVNASAAQPSGDVAAPQDAAELRAASSSRLLPVAPSVLEAKRWESMRLEKFPDDRVKQLERYRTSFPRNANGLRDSWQMCVGPDGKVYFRHSHENDLSPCPFIPSLCASRKLVILTENNLADTDELAGLSQGVALLFREAEPHADKIPEGAELVIEYQKKGQASSYSYYFAHGKPDHTAGLVFWMEGMNVEAIVDGFVHSVCSMSHLGIAMEMQYWYVDRGSSISCSRDPRRKHQQMFPVHRVVTTELLNNFQDLLHVAYSDVLTSRLSTSPFHKDQLTAFMNLASRVRKEDSSGRAFWSIARPMYYFKYHMFENYFGERCARLSIEQSIFDNPRAHSRTPSFHILSGLLFWIPDQCMSRLEKIWVDDILCSFRWNEFLSDKRKDWEKTITPATVLLSANVGLLAIQSIDNQQGHHRSAAQVASYASVTMSLSSYLIGYILSLQHSREAREGEKHPVDVDYLLRTEGLMHSRLDRLAVMYSLPSALFIWSMLSFLVAMTYIFFHNSNPATTTFLAVLLGLMVLVVTLVMMVECAASSAKGTLRQKLCSIVVSSLL